MKSHERRVGIIVLLALLTSTSILSAQDSTPIRVVGSGIVAPILQSLATESGTTVTLDVNITGTNSGFEQFCLGQADLATATRTITASEDSQCTQNNLQYTELLVAHNIIAFIAKADSSYSQCLTAANLEAIFPPSAQGQTTNWQQVSAENTDTPLTVFIPQSDSPTFAVLDNLIPGDGIRADASTESNDDTIIAAVSADTGAIGVVSLKSAVAAGDTVKALELNTNDAVGCSVPSTDNVEAQAYTAADDLFVYANKASLEKAGLREWLTFVSSDQAATAIGALGFEAPSAAVYGKNQSGLEGIGDTRPFSSATTSFQIPLDVAGPVDVAGATSARQYLTDAASAFQGIYQQVTIEVKTAGQPAGIRRLCNGEIDIAVIASELTDEQSQNCDANNIQTLPIDLGKQVVVLVANKNSSQLTCLTTEQLKKTWQASSSKIVTNWNQVDSSFPDEAITLFAPSAGDSYTDLLMINVAGVDIPARDDTEVNSDPLYRAAATANAEGALTLMSWADYQSVLANGQERIQPVGIDSGNGCVTPSDQTIVDGSYPLTRSAQLLVNTKSLYELSVQSFLWYLASDENYSLLEQGGLIGVNFGSLASLRDTLETAYLEAAQTAAEATPEATAESTAETTPEATVEATPSS